MTLLDRYIVRTYLLNFVILLVVLSILMVIGSVLLDLDEYVGAGERLASELGGSTLGWTLWSIFDYDGPMQLMLYAVFSGIIALGAAGFTFAGLARSRELTAMLSSGISMYRIALPVLLVGFALNFLTVLDQEFLLPPLASKLSRSKADLKKPNQQARPIYFMADGQGQLFCAGDFTATRDQFMLMDIVILRRNEAGQTINRIVASQGMWDEQRKGWDLTEGYLMTSPRPPGSAPGSPPGSAQKNAPSKSSNNQASHEVNFVASDLTPTVIQASQASNYLGFLSIRQLRKLLSHSQVDTRHVRQIMHSRMSQLVLNMLVLAMGLTFFMPREPTNMMFQAVKAAGLCLGAWSMGLVMQNTQIEWLNPVATAWLPVVIYIPVTAFILQTLKT